jgi:hypothetical protein
VGAARTESDTSWVNPLGKRRDVRDRHRELAVTLREREGGRTFSVVFRAFDDGVALSLPAPEAGRRPWTTSSKRS